MLDFTCFQKYFPRPLGENVIGAPLDIIFKEILYKYVVNLITIRYVY